MNAVEDVSPHCTMAAPAGTLTVEQRIHFLTGALEDWLQVPPETRKKISFALPVLHTEAWLIAIGKFAGDAASVDAKSVFRLNLTGREKREPYYKRTVDALMNGEWTEPTCFSYQAFKVEVDNSLST